MDVSRKTSAQSKQSSCHSVASGPRGSASCAGDLDEEPRSLKLFEFHFNATNFVPRQSPYCIIVMSTNLERADCMIEQAKRELFDNDSTVRKGDVLVCSDSIEEYLFALRKAQLPRYLFVRCNASSIHLLKKEIRVSWDVFIVDATYKMTLKDCEALSPVFLSNYPKASMLEHFKLVNKTNDTVHFVMKKMLPPASRTAIFVWRNKEIADAEQAATEMMEQQILAHERIMMDSMAMEDAAVESEDDCGHEDRSVASRASRASKKSRSSKASAASKKSGASKRPVAPKLMLLTDASKKMESEAPRVLAMESTTSASRKAKHDHFARLRGESVSSIDTASSSSSSSGSSSSISGSSGSSGPKSESRSSVRGRSPQRNRFGAPHTTDPTPMLESNDFQSKCSVRRSFSRSRSPKHRSDFRGNSQGRGDSRGRSFSRRSNSRDERPSFSRRSEHRREYEGEHRRSASRRSDFRNERRRSDSRDEHRRSDSRDERRRRSDSRDERRRSDSRDERRRSDSRDEHRGHDSWHEEFVSFDRRGPNDWREPLSKLMDDGREPQNDALNDWRDPDCPNPAISADGLRLEGHKSPYGQGESVLV